MLRLQRLTVTLQKECVEQRVAVVAARQIARHYTLFLCQNGVLNQAILAHLIGMFAHLAKWVLLCVIHEDGFTRNI